MDGKDALNKLFFDNKDIKVDITLNDRKVCEIYNTIKQDLERLEKVKNLIPIIDEKIENAQNDLYSRKRDNDFYEIRGQTMAYVDIWLLLKEVLEDEKS